MRLGDVAEVVTGTTPSKAELGYYGGSIPFVTPAELERDAPITSATTFLTEEGAAEARVVPTDAVLVCCIGSLGKVGIAGRPLVTNQQINALVFDSALVFSRYGFHFARTLKTTLAHMAPATTIAIVNKSRFSDISIPLPPLPEQRRIAYILDKADAIRRKRKEAIALTEELLRSAFLEMFGDPVTNPKGWPVKPLGNYLSFVTSGSRGWAEHYSDEGERFIRSLDVQMDWISDEDAAYVAAPPGAEAERTRVQQDDVLLTITGSKIGRAARATAVHVNAYVSQHVAILRLLPGLDPDVVAAFLVSDRGGQALIARTQYGQTKPGLNLAQIRAFSIPVPPERVQSRLRATRKEVRAIQERLGGALRSSEDLFNSLVNRAFTGGISC
jgi:type I restriction enzyme S subunit